MEGRDRVAGQEDTPASTINFPLKYRPKVSRLVVLRCPECKSWLQSVDRETEALWSSARRRRRSSAGMHAGLQIRCMQDGQTLAHTTYIAPARDSTTKDQGCGTGRASCRSPATGTRGSTWSCPGSSSSPACTCPSPHTPLPPTQVHTQKW